MNAPYVYDDAHSHRLTIAPVSNTLDQRYVSLTAECMDIGGDMANVWLSMPDVHRLAAALAGRVPFEHADHMGDTVTVAPAEDWTTFTVMRAGRDDDETPVTVRVVVLTARLSQVARGIQSAELAAEVAEHGAFPVPVGPQPRTLDVVEDELTGVSLSLYEEELTSERLRWALASAKRGRARLRAQVAALLKERRTTNEALDDAVQELRARQSCPCPPADQPGPHQLGCPQAEVPPSERPVNELTAVFAPVAALREVPSGETDPGRRAAWRMLSREEPHDSPLHQDHLIPHDLQVPKSCRLDAEGLDEVSRRFIGGSA